MTGDRPTAGPRSRFDVLRGLAVAHAPHPLHINCDLPLTSTDSEGRTLTFARDALDRLTTVTYPDSTVERYEYTALDCTKFTDRMGRSTTYTYNANRKIKAVLDPLQRLTKYDWYPDGELKSITDANNRLTQWLRGTNPNTNTLQIKKIFHDNRTYTYDYDIAGRLRSISNPLNETKTIDYNLDDSVKTVTYSGAAVSTSSVALTYDPMFRRVKTMTDGIGTTTWTYVPVGTKGALSIESEVGPFANDATTNEYDEVGRLSSRTVSGVTELWQYDAIGRVRQHTTPMGTFDYTYLGQTPAIRTRALVGSTISTEWTYDTNMSDRRLTSVQNSNGGPNFILGYDRFEAPAGKNLYEQVSSIARTGGNLTSQHLEHSAVLVAVAENTCALCSTMPRFECKNAKLRCSAARRCTSAGGRRP